jgi:hypothetical protein
MLHQEATQPIIAQQLLQGLQQWRQGTIQDTSDMIAKQSHIGCEGILEGSLWTH